MPDCAENELFLGDVQPLGQRTQRRIGAGADAIDGRVAGVFAVARIIDEEKRIAVIGIATKDRCPIQR
jgi:hypothetical protein